MPSGSPRASARVSRSRPPRSCSPATERVPGVHGHREHLGARRRRRRRRPRVHAIRGVPRAASCSGSASATASRSTRAGIATASPSRTCAPTSASWTLAPYHPEPELPRIPRVLAALRPPMIELARECADGMLSYLVTPAHTAMARAVLGPDRLLCAEQATLLVEDPAEARRIARERTSWYFDLGNYPPSLRAQGFRTRISPQQRPHHRRARGVGRGGCDRRARARAPRRRRGSRVHSAAADRRRSLRPRSACASSRRAALRTPPFDRIGASNV